MKRLSYERGDLNEIAGLGNTIGIVEVYMGWGINPGIRIWTRMWLNWCGDETRNYDKWKDYFH